MTRPRRPTSVSVATGLLALEALLVFLSMGFFVLPNFLGGTAVMIVLCVVPSRVMRGTRWARIAVWVLMPIVAWRVVTLATDGSGRASIWWWQATAWAAVATLGAASVLLLTPAANAYFRASVRKPTFDPRILD